MTDSNSIPTHEQIARRAYEIFIERGQPAGQDLAHWLEAERQLRAAGKTSATAQVAGTQIRAAQPPPSNGRTQQGNGRTQRATARK
jgi:hypothetical protein